MSNLPTPTPHAMSQPAPQPTVRHHPLKTTFVGVDHPSSTPESPVAQYRGIQYATLPARFRRSKLVTSYPDVVDATKFGPICPQPRPVFSCQPPFPITPLTEPTAEQREHILHQDEFECLNLNITCPRRAAASISNPGLPVMLWFHGGGHRGAGSSWHYDGGSLVQKGVAMRRPVIVVTFNYRLGIFGCAASPAIRDDNEANGDAGVGNYGLRDQQTILEWIHRYIGGFGGDPERVTLFGEGTGATDILRQLRSASNEREPLFARAIVQSPIGCATQEVSTVQNAGYHLTKTLGALHLYGLDQFRAADPAILASISKNYPVRAVDDARFFCKNWRTTPGIEAPYQPVVIGDNSLSSLTHSKGVSGWSSPTLTRRVKAITQSLAKASSLLRAYDVTSSTPDWELPDRLVDLIGDARWAFPVDRAAKRLQVSAGGQVYRYVWDQDAPGGEEADVPGDLVYLFDAAPPPADAPGDSPFDTAVFDDVDDVELEELLLAQSPASLSSSARSDSTTSCLSLWNEPPPVDAYAYARVRDAVQGRWIAFAAGEAPWDREKVYVFGPEGECGPRSKEIFEGRRRVKVWEEAFEPLGMDLVQKISVELANGP